MYSLTDAPDSLETIFPEVKTLDEKALLFIELKDSGASFRSMGRSLGIHHQTASKLHKFLKETQIYSLVPFMVIIRTNERLLTERLKKH